MIATIIAVTTGILLGNWQMDRAGRKEVIETRLKVRETAPPVVLGSESLPIEELEYRRVIAEGEFVRNWPVYLENRPYNGTPGFYMLMPLKVSGSDRHVLVARGWFPRDPADRAKLPAIEIPDGTVRVEGIARRNPGQLLQLGEATPLRPGAIVQNLSIDEFAEASGFTMHAFVIEQHGAADDTLVRDWPRPSSGIDKHLGYAFQWYALAGAAFIFFVVTGFRRGTR